ncbi:hypothetical protein BRC82_09685 [Halobacteriales archaeon QS_1_67_19]|nr:MAG: hypothetical protein BRC82_09685 [Halobacteriales archaeon QS_1_67_19]
MTTNATTGQKTVVQQLNFGAKTAKRVTWEEWEFTVVGPHQIEVANAAYGYEKDEHSYVVGVEERDGRAVPAECECKADRYNEEYDCKHKIALATVGGSVVLQAAVDFPTLTVDTERTTASTLEDKLRADGGAVVEKTDEDSPRLDAKEHDECDCAELSDLPCFECYRERKKSV